MKALFIGGTGNISTAVSALAAEKGWELTLLNRGNHVARAPEDAEILTADARDEAALARLLNGRHFDVVADFIAFEVPQVERDIRLFADNTDQYIFISSASVYQKPLSYPIITESTPTANPFSEYARNKITCEERLMREYRENGFPVTVVRPSHTYGEGYLPLPIPSRLGAWQTLLRMKRGKQVLVHGDGSSLWAAMWNGDFAKAFIGLMGNRAALGETVHITTDEIITWNQIYDCIGAALGVHVEKFHVSTAFLCALQPDWTGGFIGDKMHSVIFDNSKIKRLVPGFVATTRFDQGARKCVDYICAHAEMQREDPEYDAFCDRIIHVQQEALAAVRRLSGAVEEAETL